MLFTPLFFTLFVAFPGASAHMTIWHPSMFAFNGPAGCTGDACIYEPAWPIGLGSVLGPGLPSIYDWWFRGPLYTGAAQQPNSSEVAELPAGGKVTFEIACAKKYTSYGTNTTVPGSKWDACPERVEAYHAQGGPEADISEIQDDLIGGCALGIFDGTDWTKASMDNIVIFSTQPECVKQKVTSFDVPKNMPPCTGDHCICAWFWLGLTGTQNFYMTGFNCAVTGGSTKHKISVPQDPIDCKANQTACVTGAKKPLYVYNSPTDVVGAGLYDVNKPQYNGSWSFTIQGAQTDIFYDATASPTQKTAATATFVASASSSTASKSSTASPPVLQFENSILMVSIVLIGALLMVQL